MEQNAYENIKVYDNEPLPDVVVTLVKSLPQQEQALWALQYLYSIRQVEMGLPLKAVA